MSAASQTDWRQNVIGCFDQSSRDECCSDEHARFGEIDGRSTAVWASAPELEAGTFGKSSGASLNRFLEQCRSRKVSLVLLVLDSAGVSLREPSAGMEAVAEAVKQLHDLNARAGVVTVSLIGARRGCFGGALLVAGACQYRFADPQAQIGVSGPKVIELLTKQPRAGARDWYSAAFRCRRGETDGELSVQRLAQLATLKARTLSQEALSQQIEQLEAEPADLLAVWVALISGRPLSLGMLKTLATWVLTVPAHQQTVLLPANAVQPFSFTNEERSFSTYLALLSAAIRYQASRGIHFSMRADGKGGGATFIAWSMMGDSFLLQPGAAVEALPEPVIVQMTGHYELAFQA